jgi:uroporphyrinogen-III synthase
MKALAGIGTLLTRPPGQNESLAASIEDLGGHAYVYPLFDIRPLAGPRERPLRVVRPNRFDGIVFVSPNAVRHGRAALGRGWPRGVRYYAVGEGTAQALAEAGIRQVVTPLEGAGGEALAAHPALAEVARRSFLIVRGRDGRRWLAETLRARGAEVEEIEVYERVEHPDPDERLVNWLLDGILDVIVVSSESVLGALVRRVANADVEVREQLFRLALLSASRRVLESARHLGFQHDGLLAPATSEEAQLATLVEWWSGSEDEP